jgi:hypothetical protein
MTVRRLGLAAAAVLVAAALVTSLLVLVLGEDQAPLAVRLLDRSRAFVGAAQTTAFEVRSRFELDDLDFGGTFTATGTGVVAFPDRFRLSEESEGFTYEVIGIGDTFYVREAEDVDDLPDEKWAEFDPGESDERSGVVRPPIGDEGLAGGPGATAAGSPTDLRRILRVAASPEVLRRTDDGLLVVGADLDPDRAFGDTIGEDLDSARLELTTTRRGRVARMVIRFEAEDEKGSVDYRLSGWNRPVRVVPPPDDEIDPTPLVDEEELAGFTAAPLLQPAAIPEGWVFDGAYVLPAEETVEECEQVELDYIDPDSEDGFLWLYELPIDCADLAPERGSVAFPGRPGWVLDEDGFVSAQIVVGRTVVQAQTDLEPADLAAVLAELVPFDPARTPGTLPGVGNSPTDA